VTDFEWALAASECYEEPDRVVAEFLELLRLNG
jgi:hypothetical protein